ncbi:MAG: MoaD/ThiS family protein [Gammaproteobacteria bacterium]|nr:MoaD/ThiS family protein [Gammaproteobacteria bacterium]
MAVTVRIPSPLQKLTSGQAAVEVDIADAALIEDLIDGLENAHPGIKNKLVDNGEIRGYVNIFVNEEDIRFMEGTGTQVREGDIVTIMPSIAGGV